MLTYIYNFFFPTESEYIQRLRQRKKELKAKSKEMAGFKLCNICHKSECDHDPFISSDDVDGHIEFITRHEYDSDGHIIKNSSLISTFLRYEDVYSPMADIVMANMDIETKRRFVNVLLSYGFSKNNDYKMMQQLILYDAIPKNKIIFFNVELLPEIKNYILSLIIELYKDQLLC